MYPHDISPQEYVEILHAVLSIYRDCNVTTFPIDFRNILKHYGFRLYSYSTLREQKKKYLSSAARIQTIHFAGKTS